LKPLCAKYLSLWSTKGQVNEWYRFCRVQLWLHAKAVRQTVIAWCRSKYLLPSVTFS
jgi:hypothetical protein